MRHVALRFLTAFIAVCSAIGFLAPTVVDGAGNGVPDQTSPTIVLRGPFEGSVNVAFAQLTIAPGGSAALPAMPGWSVHFLMSGSWAASLSPVAGRSTPGAAPADTWSAMLSGTPVATGTPVTITPGAALVVPPSTSVDIRNSGFDEAVSNSITIGDLASVPVEGGSLWHSLGDPVVLPGGSIHISMTRMTLDPGVTTNAGATDGTELIDVQSGPILLVLNPGRARISRASGKQVTIRAGFEDPFASPDPFLEEEEGGPGIVSSPPGTPVPGTATMLNSSDAAILAPGSSRVLLAPEGSAATVVVIRVSAE